MGKSNRPSQKDVVWRLGVAVKKLLESKHLNGSIQCDSKEVTELIEASDLWERYKGVPPKSYM